MGTAEVEAFLTSLAVEGRVAASTQNQAMAALLFLHRHILEKPLDSIDAPRAKRPSSSFSFRLAPASSMSCSTVVPGLASVVTGALFLGAMFVGPLASIVPAEATASALVVVGFLMAQMLRELDWSDVATSAPAFLTAVTMPFTWSISNGIGAGAIAYVVLQCFAGRARAVHPLMWGVAVAFGAIEPIATRSTWRQQ